MASPGKGKPPHPTPLPQNQTVHPLSLVHTSEISTSTSTSTNVRHRHAQKWLGSWMSDTACKYAWGLCLCLCLPRECETGLKPVGTGFMTELLRQNIRCFYIQNVTFLWFVSHSRSICLRTISCRCFKMLCSFQIGSRTCRHHSQLSTPGKNK